MERFKLDNQTLSHVTKTPASADSASDQEKAEKDSQVDHAVVPIQDEEEERFEWREVWRGKTLDGAPSAFETETTLQGLQTFRPG